MTNRGITSLIRAKKLVKIFILKASKYTKRFELCKNKTRIKVVCKNESQGISTEDLNVK